MPLFNYTRLALYTAILLLIVLAAPAYAVDPSSNSDVVTGFQAFGNTIGALVSKALSNPKLTKFVHWIFLVFFVIGLLKTISIWIITGGAVVDLFEFLCLAGAVTVLIRLYDKLTAACWQAANTLASVMQEGLLGNGDLFFAPGLMGLFITNIIYPELPTLNIPEAFRLTLFIWTLSGMSLILSALAYISTVWALWGYVIAKLIGFIALPFLMTKRLAFIFDGWLRFFFGFLVYAIIARINIALVIASIFLYYGYPVPPTAGGIVPIQLDAVSSITQWFGLITFMLVGIVALLSTGTFVGTIVGGNSAGSMGASIRGVARFVALRVI